jgi:hypothetical protein
MDQWYKLPVSVPDDGSTCWVRIQYYYSQPFKAIYSASDHSFTSLVNSIVYPAWSVARWKPYVVVPVWDDSSTWDDSGTWPA